MNEQNNILLALGLPMLSIMAEMKDEIQTVFFIIGALVSLRMLIKGLIKDFKKKK